MATAHTLAQPFVSVEEYLRTDYRPDVDYVDGVVEDRNVGELDHSSIQRAILFALTAFEEKEGVYVIQETRTQTQATRFRVPDIAVLCVEDSQQQIIRNAPLLCIEVMSPEDHLSRLRKRCDDYIRSGVGAVWIFDGARETAYVLTASQSAEASDGVLRLEGTQVFLDVSAVFASARRRATPHSA